MKGRNGAALDYFQTEYATLRQQLMEAQCALMYAHGQRKHSMSTTGDQQADSHLPDMERGTYRRLLESSPHGVALLSATGLVLQANQRLAQLIETCPERLSGSRLADHLPEQLTHSLHAWLDDSDQRPVRASHRVFTRNGQVRHLHFSVTKLPPGSAAARSLIVTDLDQLFDSEAPRVALKDLDTVDQSIRRARAEALSLLESALAAHSRAEAINAELQREIDSRKRVEALLRETQQRYERMLAAIGDAQWSSGTDPRRALEADDEQSRPGDPDLCARQVDARR